MVRHDIFLSYASEDRERVRHLVNALQAAGLNVFWDRKIPPGLTRDRFIESALLDSGAVIVIWTEHSITSDFVKEEANHGKEKDILIPILFDRVQPPLGYDRVQAADLVDWDGKSDTPMFQSLLADIDRVLGSETQSSIGPCVVGDKAGSSFAPEHVFCDALKSGGDGPEMVSIPAGKFVMGSADSESGHYDDEGPVRGVSVAAFALGRYAVTFAEYDRFAQATARELPDDEGWGRSTRPVINVSWEDTTAYARWLSEETGATYRLPSEAEWEYAARSGSTARYWWGDAISRENEVMANCAGCGSEWGGEQTAPVGSFAVNGFGLYDLHGNVWEWTQDCWHKNYRDAPLDARPREAAAGGDCSRRVVRGGSWSIGPKWVRSAGRNWDSADVVSIGLGFRLARTIK